VFVAIQYCGGGGDDCGGGGLGKGQGARSKEDFHNGWRSHPLSSYVKRKFTYACASARLTLRNKACRNFLIILFCQKIVLTLKYS
jgi:hypothetical protein